jgi:hypothetical protein
MVITSVYNKVWFLQHTINRATLGVMCVIFKRFYYAKYNTPCTGCAIKLPLYKPQ